MFEDIASRGQMIDCLLDRNVGVYVQIFGVIVHPVFCNAFKTDRMLSSRPEMISQLSPSGEELVY